MSLVATTAVWMAALMAAWAVITGVAGARRDARLADSGARALHATAVLMVTAVVVQLIQRRADFAEAPAAVAAVLAVRGIWTDVGARLVAWGAVVGIAGGVVTAVVRREARPDRVKAQVTVGAITLAFTLLAAGGSYLVGGATADEAGTGPVAVQVWPGVLARILYAAGLAAMLIPIALRPLPARRDDALRWTVGALALTIGALALAGWVRYAVAAPPAVLDADGMPGGRGWSSTATLWAVPSLLIAAHAFAVGARAAAGDPSVRRTSSAMRMILIALAAVLALAVVVPAIQDWTQAREVAPGMVLHPPLVVLVALPALIAVLVLVVRRLAGRVPMARIALTGTAGAIAMALLAMLAGVRDAATLAALATAAAGAALVSRGIGEGAPSRRLLAMAQAGTLLLIGAALAAISIRPAQVELEPGSARSVEVRNRPWRITSQGASQVEQPLFDGGIVAIEVESPGRASLVTAGERIYRDAHGHAGTRIAVPGIVHGATGDVRLLVQGIRGDAALVQAQHHPLALLAWILAAVVVVALLSASLAGGLVSGPARPPEASAA